MIVAIQSIRLPLTPVAFGNSTLSDLSGFFSYDSKLISEENPLRLPGVLFPNAPYHFVKIVCACVCV